MVGNCIEARTGAIPKRVFGSRLEQLEHSEPDSSHISWTEIIYRKSGLNCFGE